MATTTNKPMSQSEEEEVLASLHVRMSADELAEQERDTPAIKRAKAILRGDINPHARDAGNLSNFTHLNINSRYVKVDPDGTAHEQVVWVHPKNRAPGDDSKNGWASIAPNAELREDKDGFLEPVEE